MTAARPRATAACTALAALVLLSMPQAAWGQGLLRVLERIADPPPPFVPAIDEVLAEHEVNGLSLGEYLVTLDFEGPDGARPSAA